MTCKYLKKERCIKKDSGVKICPFSVPTSCLQYRDKKEKIETDFRLAKTILTKEEYERLKKRKTE
jgi:hypothetical protein